MKKKNGLKKWLAGGIGSIFLVGLVSVGCLGLLSIVAAQLSGGYITLFGKKVLTPEEIVNINDYGCPCGDCSQGIMYIGDGSPGGGVGDTIIGGDFSGTHNGDSLAFKSENISGLGKGQTDNAKEIYTILRGYGFTHEAASGIMGNMWQESTFAVELWGSGNRRGNWEAQAGTYYGLVQANKDQIRSEWLPYLTSVNKDINTIDGYIDGLVYVLTSGSESTCFNTYPNSSFRTNFDGFKAMTDSEMACDLFCVAYERCVTENRSIGTAAVSRPQTLYQHLSSRKRYAKTIDEYFKGSDGGSGNGSLSSNNGNGGNNSGNGGQASGSENGTSGNVNSRPISGTTSVAGLTIPSRGSLMAGEGQYNVPIWNGYSKDSTGNDIIVPISTDNRKEPFYYSDYHGGTTPETKTIAERAKDGVVSTENPDQLNATQANGRLCVAVGGGFIAWPDDVDHSDSMIGVEFDVVLGNGVVIPCVFKDAKATVHTGQYNMYFVGGKYRSSIKAEREHIAEGKSHAEGDFSFLEFIHGQGRATNWLREYTVAAGGIDHVKVYNHKNKNFALGEKGCLDGDTLTGSSSSTSQIPQPGNGGGGGVNTNVTLNYGPENVDIPNWTSGTAFPREYDITECRKIVVQHKMMDENTFSQPMTGPLEAFVVHYWAGDGNSGAGLVNWFNQLYREKGTKNSSNFIIGNDGVVWQTLSLKRSGYTSNDNKNKYAVECANIEKGQYNEDVYNSLVHLTAWMTVKFNLSTDFKWDYNYKNGQPLHKYRDLGNIRRHYDNPLSSGAFRGKPCPAYWVPNDGTKDDVNAATYDGGNARWIAFKEDVTDYIIRFRDHPNFEIEGVLDEGAFEQFKNPDSNANWSNGVWTGNGGTSGGGASNVDTNPKHYKGRGCDCEIPCKKCNCHDEEWNEILSGNGSTGSGEEGTGNVNGPSSGNWSGGLSDYVQGSGDTRRQKGLASAEGVTYKIEDGKLIWTGNTWNSTVFLLNARYVAQMYIAAGATYSQRTYLNLGGNIGSARCDCSGFVSACLKNLGYGNQILNSSGDWSCYGFQLITDENNIEPGDIIQYNGHTQIFAGWIDKSRNIKAAYDFGSDNRLNGCGPNYYEPTDCHENKAFKRAWRPVPRDATINGVFYSKDGNYGGTGSIGNVTGNVSELAAGSIVENVGNIEDYFTVKSISSNDEVFNRINGKSFPVNHDGIELSDLRYVKILHYNFNGKVQVGELIVNKAIANDVVSVFKELYQSRYQIDKVYLVDKYWTGDGDSTDIASMNDNNSSSFNYRLKTSGTSLSKHGLGMAIDINTLQNPYVDNDGNVTPPSAGEYADRSNKKPHMIDSEDEAVKIFKKYGFTWGGDWSSIKDYQHFEK